MASIETFDDIEQELARYVPLTRQITGRQITLERMAPLMSALGNPQKKLKIVHIAGTSGKTSTAYYIASLLSEAGQITGLTISPHIDSVAERIQINLQPLSEKDFSSALTEVLHIVHEAKLEPTYFELLIGLAYWYFAKAGVDYAVIETGMGGLHDGTNIADNPDKICVITDIGLDHMHVLGQTVSEIAAQKAGIIHFNNPVVMHQQAFEVMKVIKEWAEAHQAIINVIQTSAQSPGLDTLPEFQQRNWMLAHETYQMLRHRDGLPDLDTENLSKSMSIRIPGRMDEVRIGNKTIIMDGAHNEQKTEALVHSFKRRYPGAKIPILLSLKEGKEAAAVLPIVKGITSKLIVTEFESSQDLPAESIDAHVLVKIAERIGIPVLIEPDPEKAFELWLSKIEDVGLITGSFYLIGQLRRNHKELHA